MAKVISGMLINASAFTFSVTYTQVLLISL